jgi:hypothetical protein
MGGGGDLGHALESLKLGFSQWQRSYGGYGDVVWKKIWFSHLLVHPIVAILLVALREVGTRLVDDPIECWILYHIHVLHIFCQDILIYSRIQ